MKGEMVDATTIKLPVAVGDPVLIIAFNQHDGYYTEVATYDVSMVNREVFITKETAIKYIQSLQKIESRR